MVFSDNGLPDPDNPNEDLRPNNDNFIGITEVDSDQELDNETFQIQYTQYQPLPTGSNDELDSNSDSNNSNEEDETEDFSATINSNQTEVPVPPITPIESTLLKELWSGPLPEICDIKMDSQKVDEVKKAMLNVTLSESAIPDWATNIPEEEWKLQLMKRLKK